MKTTLKNIESRYREERRTFFHDFKNLDRRSFLKASAAAVGAAVGGGLIPCPFQSVSIAQDTVPAEGGGSFRFAWISDSHLYEKKVNDRFVRSILRAVEDINNLDPQPDFVFYGGDF